ncbi:MAG TPA: DUF6531 domain-containing protein, partial [Roseimicrobium sp.]|nr:DUF6531 domain-containing protein [Roseimicrobium sp.]
MSGTLPTTGTYTVVTNGIYYANSGTVLVYFLQGADSVSSGSLTSGGVKNDTLPLNGIKSYQFSGTAGKAAMIFMNSNSAYTNYITVYKPDGSVLSWDTDRWSNNSLPTTGTYTVAVVAQYPAQSGPYDLYYVHGAEGVANGEMLGGQPQTETMAPNQLWSFKLNAPSVRNFMLFIGATFGANIYIYKPDGSYYTWTNTKRFSNSNFALPNTGDYTVLVFAQYITDTGEFNLYPSQGAGDASEGEALNGKVRAGNSMPLNGLQSFSFTGTSGNPLTISTSGSFTYRVLYIFKPDGTYWTAYNNTWPSLNLPATGTYLLNVYASSAATTGTYDVTVNTTPITEPPTDPERSDMPKTCQAKTNVSDIKGLGTASAKVEGGMSVMQTSPNNTGPISFAGNPINFDLGYKLQVDTDYDADGLSFTRIYRSDSTWTDNTVGTLWRHNYARTLAVSGSAASIVNGSGTKMYYTLTGGNWVPNDPSNRAVLKTITGGYSYTLPDNTVEKYNSTFLLTRIEYPAGGALNLGYNGSNQLTSVTNESGRQITLTYSSGRVATVVTPDGTFSYSYTSGKLTTVTRPDTKTTIYHYENVSYVNALTGITDAKGVRWATFGYNGSGKAISTQYAGPVNTYTAAFGTNSSTITNPLSKDTVYYYKNIQGVRRAVLLDGIASTNCVASNRNVNYDKLGRVISITDWENNITRYRYDSRSNVTQIVEAYNTAQRRITNISWLATLNLPDVIREPGLTTDYDYDTYGRLVTMTQTDTATAATRITTYAYYSNGTDGSGNVILGRLQQVDGPRTDVSDITSYAYDGNYNLTT